MSRRYRDVNRGPLLALAYQHKQEYLQRPQGERGQSIGQRTASPAFYVLVKPFTQDLTGASNSYRVRTNQRNHQILGTAIGAHAVAIGADSTYLESQNFLPAKIKLFTKTGSTAATSKITGIRYLKSNGTSHSHPFGAAAAGDREFTVFSAIASELRNENPNNRVTFSAEKIRE